MFKDHLIFSNNFQDAANQLRLHEALSQKLKDENKTLFDTIAKMDADRERRQNKINPTTGKSYLDVANQATKESLERASSKENYDELAKTAPNLAARARFNSQSAARSASNTGMNSYSDMASFGALSPEDQNRVAPTQNTRRLQDMRQAQYNISSENVTRGRANASMGDNRASGINAINRELEDRKTNAMGGKAAAGSFAKSWSQDPYSERTRQSMEVRTPRERLAMLDALHQEGLKQFREKGKLDSNHVDMVNRFADMGEKESPELTAFGGASREPLNRNSPSPASPIPSPSPSEASTNASNKVALPPAVPQKSVAERYREQQSSMLRGAGRYA